MSMNLVYPARLVTAADGCTVTFRDVPGAIACGDSPLKALDEARDALALVIEDILEEGEPIPLPSKARRGEHLVAVPADVGARALLRLIRDTKDLSKAAVAERVGVSRQSYGQMEARGRNLTLKTLTDITEKLGYEVLLEERPRNEVDASSAQPGRKTGKRRLTKRVG
jgi:antitoxin HicB